MPSIQDNINQKIEKRVAKIKLLYPKYCTSCDGRGGVMVDWYEGCEKFVSCKDCVHKGLDPLTKEPILPPENYGLYEYEDGELFTVWCDSEDFEYHRSSSMGYRFDSYEWNTSLMGEVERLKYLLKEIDHLVDKVDEFE